MSKLKQRADGRYCKMVRGKVFYGNSEREVMRKIIEYEEKQKHGKTFQEVADEWWKLEVELLSPSTIRGYRKATERAVDHFRGEYISDITTADITKYLYRLGKVLGYAKKTVKNHKIILDRIFHFANVQCYIQYNPAREAEIPRGLTSTTRHPATPIDESAILNADTEQTWLLPITALLTGMRKGELRGLRWEDIDLDKRIINVRRSVWDYKGTVIKDPKTEAGIRKIPIPDILYARLEQCTNRKDYVFGDDKPISEKKYRVEYERFKKETGITATAQQLRKSYATLAASAAIPPEVLASIFGHKDVSTTFNIYAEVREERIQEATKNINVLAEKKGQKNK